MNVFDQMRQAMEEAELLMRAADNCADGMARTLKGRLRNVPGYVLADLKKELRDFNIQTGRWKTN